MNIYELPEIPAVIFPAQVSKLWAAEGRVMNLSAKIKDTRTSIGRAIVGHRLNTARQEYDFFKIYLGVDPNQPTQGPPVISVIHGPVIDFVATSRIV